MTTIEKLREIQIALCDKKIRQASDNISFWVFERDYWIKKHNKLIGGQNDIKPR